MKHTMHDGRSGRTMIFALLRAQQRIGHQRRRRHAGTSAGVTLISARPLPLSQSSHQLRKDGSGEELGVERDVGVKKRNYMPWNIERHRRATTPPLHMPLAPPKFVLVVCFPIPLEVSDV